MQLSLLCDVDVTVTIHVRDKNRLIAYESCPERSMINELTSKIILKNSLSKAHIETYNNSHLLSFGV